MEIIYAQPLNAQQLLFIYKSIEAFIQIFF
jgi:hypothetical protein